MSGPRLLDFDLSGERGEGPAVVEEEEGIHHIRVEWFPSGLLSSVGAASGISDIAS